MPRNFNVYNRLQTAENEIFGRIQVNNSKSGRRSSFSSRHPKIAHDEYIDKKAIENLNAIYDNKLDLFIDKNGVAMAINQLDFTPSNSFRDLNHFREIDDFNEVEFYQDRIQKQIELGDDIREKHIHCRETSGELSSDHKKSKAPCFERKIKSIQKFFSCHCHGLYNDYNPKLNPGAPGNRKERRRQERRFAENVKWNPIIIDSYEENNIVDTILEDDEATKTFDMVIVILEDYYINRKAS